MDTRTLILFCIVFFGSASLIHGVLQGFVNGQTYVISSAATGKVMTAGRNKNFTRSATVVTSIWNEDSNQRWLALEAPIVIQISPTAREIQPARYYLIPERQQWDWNTVTKNGALNITSTNNLPPLTEVLALDSLTGNLTTEVFISGSSSQTWISEDAGENLIFLRNLGNNQCVKNFEYSYQNLYSYFLSMESYKAASLLQRIFSFISRIRKHQKKGDPNPLSTLDCNAKDISEKWIAEL